MYVNKKAMSRVKKRDTVLSLLKHYTAEGVGYGSMSQDTHRNEYFKSAMDEIWKQGATKFLEVGPGADAKLTKYVLGIKDRFLNDLDELMSTKVKRV